MTEHFEDFPPLCEGCKCTDCKGLGYDEGDGDQRGCSSCHGSGARVDQLIGELDFLKLVNKGITKDNDYLRFAVEGARAEVERLKALMGVSE
jgi:DnaJ-class molecular chaperone